MDKDAIIQEFNSRAHFELTARQHLEAILKVEPLSLMFLVEEQDGTVRMTSVPFSMALMKGLVHTAFNLAWSEDEQEDVGDGDDGGE